jgi:hypothetical protein
MTDAGVDRRLSELRDRISDEGQQLDSYRAKTAAALGGGVFLLLLAIGACYEIISGTSSIWTAIGLTRGGFYVVAGGLVVASLALLVLAWARERRRDLAREARLDKLEQEFADLLERNKIAADERE